MSDHHASVAGTVTALFAHRFVIEGKGGKYLADIGPKGAERVNLKVGDMVSIIGERKPSEIKVSEITKVGGMPIRIDHKKKAHDDKHHANVDPRPAISAVKRAGYTMIAEPRRKPKHFEILGQSAEGDVAEFHVELDGAIRKHKPADLTEPKWQSAAAAG